MPAALARPKQGSLAGGTIGLAGTTAYIKATAIDTNYSTLVADETGDGDTTPQLATNGLLYGDISVQGYLMQGQSSGFVDAVRAGAELDVVITYDTGRTDTGKILIQRVRKSWRKTAVNVPLAFVGKFTGSVTEG